MPIFMDRHDIRGVTAADIANLHSRDVAVEDKYDTKYMAYWFDAQRGTGFCLVQAPDAATAEKVHLEAHGQVASSIIPVDLGPSKRSWAASATRTWMSAPECRPWILPCAPSCLRISCARRR